MINEFSYSDKVLIILEKCSYIEQFQPPEIVGQKETFLKQQQEMTIN